MRILLVEDDRKLGSFLARGIREQGYQPVWVRSCEEANQALKEPSFDLVVLDLGLEDGDGLDLLRKWRVREQSFPVLILSARNSVEDKIKGLNLGADDYLAKPFSFDELLARIRSTTRRQNNFKASVLSHKSLTLNLAERTARLKDQLIDLTNREFALLELLLKHRGRVLTRTQISERIWNSHFDMETNLIDVYMARLRSKILQNDETTPSIRTVRGVGYVLE